MERPNAVPLPTVLCLAFGTGLAAALAARNEIRLSARHPLLTRSYAAFAIFLVLVLVPISVYFYIFHGDWFLLYLFDVREVPSAIALIGFLVEVGLGTLGFALGGNLVRSQRDAAVATFVGISLLGSLAPIALASDRLAVVGSYAQYHGGFGLSRFGEGAMLEGSALMTIVFVIGAAFLITRVWMASSRQT